MREPSAGLDDDDEFVLLITPVSWWKCFEYVKNRSGGKNFDLVAEWNGMVWNGVEVELICVCFGISDMVAMQSAQLNVLHTVWRRMANMG